MRRPFLACALARIGAADVREEREGTPDFHAVTVSDGRRPLWKMTMPPESALPP